MTTKQESGARSMTVCACQMPLHVTESAGEPVVAHSPRWHEIHRERHLMAFPDVDQRTRRNLDQAIAWASRRCDDCGETRGPLVQTEGGFECVAHRGSIGRRANRDRVMA